MLDDNFLMLGPKVDLNKIEKISTKRIASFLNFFMSQTVSFLNTFATDCEEKLNKMDARMQDIETLLVLLESKIASVPGLESLKTSATTPSTTTVTMTPTTTDNSDVLVSETVKKDVDSNATDNPTESEEVISNVGEGGIANKDNPLYKRYFGMLKVGIPMQAVKQKMIMEQIDPSILDKPNELGEVPTEAEE